MGFLKQNLQYLYLKVYPATISTVLEAKTI